MAILLQTQLKNESLVLQEHADKTAFYYLFSVRSITHFSNEVASSFFQDKGSYTILCPNTNYFDPTKNPVVMKQNLYIGNILKN